MKTGAIMRRALDCCAPILFSLTIMLFVGTIAQAQGDVSAVPELEAAHNRVQEATMTMEQAEAQNNTQAREQARIGYSKANQNMAQTLAHVAGVRTEDVSAMQKAGMGWAQIAQELGLQPAHLGMGKQAGKQTTHDGLNLQDRTRDRERDRERDRDHSQKISTEPERARERERNRELSEATSRNMKTLADTKHGMAMVGTGSKGMGLGYARGAMSAGVSRGFGGHGAGGSADHGGSGGPGGGGPGGSGGSGGGGSGSGNGGGGAGGGGGR
jgi:hypothetical protein